MTVVWGGRGPKAKDTSLTQEEKKGKKRKEKREKGGKGREWKV